MGASAPGQLYPTAVGEPAAWGASTSERPADDKVWQTTKLPNACALSTPGSFHPSNLKALLSPSVQHRFQLTWLPSPTVALPNPLPQPRKIPLLFRKRSSTRKLLLHRPATPFDGYDHLGGGAAAALLELLSVTPICYVTDPGWLYLGVSRTLTLTLLPPVKVGETVRIKAEVLAVGKRLATVKALIRSEEDGAVMVTAEHKIVRSALVSRRAAAVGFSRGISGVKLRWSCVGPTTVEIIRHPELCFHFLVDTMAIRMEGIPTQGEMW